MGWEARREGFLGNFHPSQLSVPSLGPHAGCSLTPTGSKLAARTLSRQTDPWGPREQSLTEQDPGVGHLCREPLRTGSGLGEQGEVSRSASPPVPPALQRVGGTTQSGGPPGGLGPPGKGGPPRWGQEGTCSPLAAGDAPSLPLWGTWEAWLFCALRPSQCGLLRTVLISPPGAAVTVVKQTHEQVQLRQAVLAYELPTLPTHTIVSLVKWLWFEAAKVRGDSRCSKKRNDRVNTAKQFSRVTCPFASSSAVCASCCYSTSSLIFGLISEFFVN